MVTNWHDKEADIGPNYRKCLWPGGRNIKVAKINMKLELLKSEFSVSRATFFYVTGDELSSLSIFPHLSVLGFRSLTFTLFHSELFVAGVSLRGHVRTHSSELRREGQSG